jgi:hypothetical protein
VDVLAAIAIVVAAGSAWFAWRSVRQANRANQLVVMVDFMREFRQTYNQRRFIAEKLKQQHSAEKGIHDLPDKARRQVAAVLHYLNNLGVLVERKLIDLDDVADFIGGPILRAWSKLKPYVATERKKRGGEPYQQHAESLAKQISVALVPQFRISGELRCACGATSKGGAGWRVDVVADDDGRDDRLAVYCPECWRRREFGE